MSRNRLSKFSRRVRFALSAVMFVLSGPVSSGLILFNPAVALADSNNGTIKIHELGTVSGTESNDPKVCTFNVEAYNLDPSQTGQLTFNTQGGDAPIGVDAGPYAFGPADATGYFATGYYSLQPGHYKATLSGVDGNNNNFGLTKVFKVECPVVPPVPSNGSTTAQVNCDLGGLLIHFTNGSVTPVAVWEVNDTVVTPDSSGNYLFPVAEDQSYDATVTADGVVVGHYTGTRDCVLGEQILPANPVASITAPCGSAQVVLTNVVTIPNDDTIGTAYVAVVSAPGSVEGSKTVTVNPNQTVTLNFSYLDDAVAGPIVVTVNGFSIAHHAVETDCDNDTGGLGGGGGGGTGGNDSGGEVLGDTAPIPVVTPAPSVLGASTVTELPNTGPTDLPALVIALLSGVVAYELSRRRIGQSSL